MKKGGKGEKNGKKCSDRDGRRRRKKCNIEERREKEKKMGKMQWHRWMGKNAATMMEGG